MNRIAARKQTKMSQLKLPPYQKRKTSTSRPTTLAVAGIGSSSSGGTSAGRKICLGYGIQNTSDCPVLPEGFQPLHCQVAGHAFLKGTDSLGKCSVVTHCERKLTGRLISCRIAEKLGRWFCNETSCKTSSGYT